MAGPYIALSMQQFRVCLFGYTPVPALALGTCGRAALLCALRAANRAVYGPTATAAADAHAAQSPMLKLEKLLLMQMCTQRSRWRSTVAEAETAAVASSASLTLQRSCS